MNMRNTGSEEGKQLPGQALVLGGGIAGRMTARALLNIDVPVTLVVGPETASSLACAGPGFDEAAFVKELDDSIKEAKILNVDVWPCVHRKGHLFKASIGPNEEETFGCVFISPGVPLAATNGSLPAGVEPVSGNSPMQEPARIAFLLDYPISSAPAVGMVAFRQALENTRAGGTSWVLFKHAPVVHLFGETLYEKAKLAGVRFLRFGDAAPVVQGADGASGGQGPFQVTIDDVIDREPIVFECDKVKVATNIEASSVPAPALETADGDLDLAGFLLSDSIHCHSGRSFRNGVFAVGEATGSVDLLKTLAKASAAAVSARAWMIEAAAKQDEQTVTVGLECCRCLTCDRICPHAAISFEGGVGRSQIQVSGPVCQECGICVSECPQLALDLNRMPEADIAAFLKDLEARRGENPVVVYGCQRSGGKLAESAELPPSVIPYSVPCAGRISETILWATLAAGATGVFVVGCHHGNCRSDSGTDWAGARVGRILEALGFAQSADAPVGFATVAPNESARFEKLVNEFVASAGRSAGQGSWFKKTG
jgi:heterodisulfide reductase subunit A